MNRRPRRVPIQASGHLARRFRRRRWTCLAVIVALVSLVIADQSGLLLVATGRDFRAYDGMASQVVNVVDGDTIDVQLPDTISGSPVTRVGLWGVDCPELATPQRTAEPGADESAERVRRLALNQVVILRLEPAQVRDGYGRVLAHVILPDRRSLNESLLNEGLAIAEERRPHALLSRYAQLERAARRRGAGIWSSSTPSAVLAGRTAPDS